MPPSAPLTIVHGLYPRRFFGGARYVIDLARLQTEAGHKVHILGCHRTEMADHLPPGVELHQLGLIRRTVGLGPIMNRLKPDILHGHLSHASRAFGWMLRRPPAVATMHVGYRPKQTNGLDGLIALNKKAECDSAHFAGLVERIWNWAPKLSAVDQAARQDIRAELGIPADGFIVGFCGRLHWAKDPVLLVKAFQAAGLPNSWLVMAGSGELKDEVAQAAGGADNIKLLGYRSDVARLYQAFDMLAFPSLLEQMPFVLLEAMNAGLPIAATRIDGPEEFLPQPPATLFETKDEAALTAILKAEYENGQRRVVYDMTPFDPKGQAAKIEAFYRRVIARQVAA